MTLSDEISAYAAYLNASFGLKYDDNDSREDFDRDLVKARTAMEVAWLKQKPTRI